MIFFVISRKTVFLLSRKYHIFSLDGKSKMVFLKKMHENMIFPVYMYKCYKYDITLLPKEQR